jgi:hypothetical protein
MMRRMMSFELALQLHLFEDEAELRRTALPNRTVKTKKRG